MKPELPLADILVGNDDEFAKCVVVIRRVSQLPRSHAETGQLVLYKRGESTSVYLYQDHVIETGIFPLNRLNRLEQGMRF